MKKIPLNAILVAACVLCLLIIIWLCIAAPRKEANPAPKSSAQESVDDAELSTSLPPANEQRAVSMHDDVTDEAAVLGFRERIDQLNEEGKDDIDLIDEWAKESPWDAWDYIVEQKEGADFARVFEGVFIPMAEEDAARAAALLAEVPEGSHLSDAYMFLAHYWPQQDVYAAFEWVYQLPDSPLVKMTYESIVTRYAEQSPSEAVAIYDELSDSRFKSVLSASISYHMAKESPVEALAWANSLQDSQRKQRALSAALSVVSESAYDDAISFALEQTEGELRSRLVQVMISKAVYNESQNSAAGAYRVSPELAREITSLPSVALRDRAWSASSSILLVHQPETAFTISQQVEDPELRMESLQAAFAQLYSVNPDRAMQVLSETAEEAATRTLLLGSIGLDAQGFVVPVLEP
ncbi:MULTISPECIES: hypothetical protein [unclassified Lentimonas]|uniref:hypothetical protein n=1 Tax=unclassified Lentimonas TaxID=2630993 RepID=UPI00132853E5|nr:MULTISPECIES: hypothetical protein [unclassified Lentimonas]CAA6693093.1 Unannotated [Lentimonas sp. CC19]CAA6695669.1 Unannotated [Lentimonas sp. CC10]CAA7071523.1 Unannotated [Lentimonas sp. CC11]